MLERETKEQALERVWREGKLHPEHLVGDYGSPFVDLCLFSRLNEQFATRRSKAALNVGLARYHFLLPPANSTPNLRRGEAQPQHDVRNLWKSFQK